MNEHTRISDLLPLYISGALDRDQRMAVEKHLPVCAECQADLALWKSVSGEVEAEARVFSAPRGLANQALAQVQQPVWAAAKPERAAHPSTTMSSSGVMAMLQRVIQLLRAQMPLVHREIWPASAAVVGLGYIAALIADHSGFVYALAPLITAACVSLIYGPENDPAYELALSTPTSPRQILLARLVLVFGYNLGLVLIATLGLLPVLDQPLLGTLMLSWLAPMTFLSAAALVLSLWIGAPNAISISYVAWLAQLFGRPLLSPGTVLQSELKLSPEVVSALAIYNNFWQAPLLLLALSALLFAVAVWLAGKQEHNLLNLA